MFVLTLASDQHPGLSSHSLCLSRKYVQTHLSSLTDEPGAPGLSAGSEHPGETEGSRAPRITCPTCQPAPLFTPGEKLGCCGLGSPKGTGSGVGSGSREGPKQLESFTSCSPRREVERRTEEPKEKQAGSARETWLSPPRVVAPGHCQDSWLLLSSMKPSLRTSPVDPQKRNGVLWAAVSHLSADPDTELPELLTPLCGS